MKISKSVIILAGTAIIGFAAFIYLLPSYSTLWSVDSRLNRSQVQQMSTETANEIGLKLKSGLMENTTFGTDNILVTFLQGQVGTHRANSLIRSDSIPVNQWTVVWFDASQQTKESERFQSAFSQAGKLMSYRISIPDSTAGEYLGEEEAKNVLDSCWKAYHLDVATGVSLSRLES